MSTVASAGGPTIVAQQLNRCRRERGKGWKLCVVMSLAKSMRELDALSNGQKREVERFLRWVERSNPHCGCSVCRKHADTVRPEPKE